MRKVFVILVLVLFLAQFVHPQSRTSTTGTVKLGYVRDADDGCGCWFSYNFSDLWKDKHLFVSPMDEPTFINVDGKDVKLRLITEKKEGRESKIGDRWWQTYVAGDIKVRIDYVVTKLCDPNDENCEVTYYRAKLTVMRGQQRRVVNGAAICGC